MIQVVAPVFWDSNQTESLPQTNLVICSKTSGRDCRGRPTAPRKVFKPNIGPVLERCWEEAQVSAGLAGAPQKQLRGWVGSRGGPSPGTFPWCQVPGPATRDDKGEQVQNGRGGAGAACVSSPAPRRVRGCPRYPPGGRRPRPRTLDAPGRPLPGPDPGTLGRCDGRPPPGRAPHR